MANLVIDVGNSFIKLAVFSNNQLVYNNKLVDLNTPSILEIAHQYSVKNIIVASVREECPFDEKNLEQTFNYIRFNGTAKTPIKNHYKSPESLGLDRLAAVIGAAHLFPNQHVLIIDTGTCITYDGINKNSEYFGGSISPGIKMRFDAMHHFTSKLPLVKFDENFDRDFGDTSLNAISSGAINGVLYEVIGFINQALVNTPDTKIILCGGDSAFFDTRLKNSIFAHSILHEPNLVIIGLNYFVNYQHDFK